MLLDESEIEYVFIRSPGPGGQNVNKVATAVQLHFNIRQSHSLTEDVKARLLALLGRRVNQQGELIIKASRFRSQIRNKEDARARLEDILKRAAQPQKPRKKTKPTLASKKRRLENKKLQSNLKKLRRPLIED